MNDFNQLISQHATSSCKTLDNSYSNFSQQNENSTAQSVAIIVLKLFS